MSSVRPVWNPLAQILRAPVILIIGLLGTGLAGCATSSQSWDSSGYTKAPQSGSRYAMGLPPAAYGPPQERYGRRYDKSRRQPAPQSQARSSRWPPPGAYRANGEQRLFERSGNDQGLTTGSVYSGARHYPQQRQPPREIWQASPRGQPSLRGQYQPPQKVASFDRYEVQAGDTLYAIAQASGVTVAALMRQNRLVEASRLPVGLVLRIPN